MTGISLHNIRVGDTRWVLQADTASVFREKKRVVAEVVRIDFFEGDEHVSKLTADQGILLQATDDLEARGNVRVVTDDGAILTTRVLFWDHQRAKIHTDELVRITRDDDVLTGVGMEADPGLDRIEIKEEVRGETRGDPDGLLDESGGERR
jgi:LPS export ABC transporter protein LptC